MAVKILPGNRLADPRVTPVEGVNARHLTPADLPERPDAAVVDVSFISLSLVLPAVTACLAPDAVAIVLVKPQFEAGRQEVSRGGGVVAASTNLEGGGGGVWASPGAGPAVTSSQRAVSITRRARHPVEDIPNQCWDSGIRLIRPR